jgi:predicted ferric reductase
MRDSDSGQGRESALAAVQRMVAEGRSTDEIRAALDGEAPDLVTPAEAPYGDTPEAMRAEAQARAMSAAMAIPTPGAARRKPVPKPAPIPEPVHYQAITARRKSGLVLSDNLHAGWLTIWLLCLVPITIMMLDRPYAARFGSLPLSFLTLGDMAGVVGLVMYVMSLLLSARFKWTEDLFGGLGRVFLAHQVLGSLSLVMILLHPLLVAGSLYPYGLRSVAGILIPQWAYIGTAFGILATIVMIGLMIMALFMKLAYGTFLATHRWLGLAYLLIGLHVVLVPNHITSDPLMQWYLYGLLGIGTVAFVWRTLLPNVFVRRYLYTIAKAEQKGVGIVEVTLKPVNKGIRFKAGQFVYMSVNSDTVSKEWHPFSITSADTETDLRLDIRSLGTYTQTLTQLLPQMVGMTARIEGAYGRFSFRNFANVNQVWIAGGIGISPFLSMAQALGTGPYNIDLYYSVNTESELIDLDDLANGESTDPNQVFRVFPYVQQKYNQFLSAKIVAKNTGDLATRDYLICGSPQMIESVRGELIGMGVKPNQIHSESFSY